jgi:hypothetical protein
MTNLTAEQEYPDNQAHPSSGKSVNLSNVNRKIYVKLLLICLEF